MKPLRLFAITLVLLVIATSAFAELRITGETKVKQHKLVRLKAEGEDAKGAGFTWTVAPECDISEEPDGRLLLVGPPGTYTVTLLAVNFEAKKLTKASTKVTIEGVKSTPPRQPIKPKPKTPPGTCPPGGCPPEEYEGDPHNARAKIVFGNAGCSATVVYPQRPDGKWDLLSAAHCVTKVGQKGKAVMADGTELAVTCAVVSVEPDITWLVTDEAVEGLPSAVLATELPEKGVAVWHRGYGVDKPNNKESGTVRGASPYRKGQLEYETLNISSGDSGAGVFRTDNGEIVSTIFGKMGNPLTWKTCGGDCVTAWALRPIPDNPECCWPRLGFNLEKKSWRFSTYRKTRPNVGKRSSGRSGEPWRY